MTVAIGIDGCKSGWFYFRFDGAVATFGAVETVDQILVHAPDDAQVLIDIPIGLKERGRTERQCDLDARELLSPLRQSSVFPAPCRQALNAGSYQKAVEKNRKVLGRGLSRQTWNIMSKIREVDDSIRRSQRLRKILKEAHPELLFRGLAGGPMSHNKQTREGFTERMTILKIFDTEAETLISSAFLAHGGFDAGRDDIVDAFILAHGARQPTKRRTGPEQPPTDPKGLPMQMVYLLR